MESVAVLEEVEEVVLMDVGRIGALASEFEVVMELLELLDVAPGDVGQSVAPQRRDEGQH